MSNYHGLFQRKYFQILFLALSMSVGFLGLIWWLAPLFPVNVEATRYFFFYKEANFSLGTLLARWDAQIYLALADQGYLAQNYTLYAFFPLYPLILHGVSLIIPNIFVVSLLINLVAVSLGTLFLWKWCIVLGFEQEAGETVWFFLITPALIFFLAPYSEAMFFVLSIVCLYYMEKTKYGVASLFGLLATLTRPTGFLLIIPLLTTFLWRKKKISEFRQIHYKFNLNQLVVLLLPLGLLCLYILGKQATGVPDFYTLAQAHYGRLSPSLSAFMSSLTRLSHFYSLSLHEFQNSQIDSVWVLTYIIVLIFAAEFIPMSYVFYALALVILPLATGNTMSSVRMLAISPIHYLALARLARRWPWFGKIASFVSIGFAITFAILFTHWEWVA